MKTRRNLLMGILSLSLIITLFSNNIGPNGDREPPIATPISYIN